MDDDDMSDVINNDHHEDTDYGSDLYKQWFKTGDRSGFLALRPWLVTGKISVDIGELKGNQLVGNTQVWANIVDLATYLKAVTDGTAKQIYPKYERGGVPTDEGFVYYGGGTMDGKTVSRILKIHHWQTGDDSYDSSAFVFKAGHFAGKKSSTGAVIPNMSECLSMNMIKVTRRQIAEMNLRLQYTLAGHAARNEEWYSWKKK